MQQHPGGPLWELVQEILARPFVIEQGQSVCQAQLIPQTPERIRSETALCIYVCINVCSGGDESGRLEAVDGPLALLTLTPGCIVARLKLNRKGIWNQWTKDDSGIH